LTDKFVVGYSGNFGRVHEFQTLMGAAERLRARSDIVFLLIGAGAQRSVLETAASIRGVSNLVFKPYQPRGKLGQSLGAADVHVVTLRPELEGLVVPSKFYGVAAIGRPTIFIGDSQGEIATIIREADCGISVNQGDVGGMVAAVERLRDDVPLRETMGRNARAVFERRFDRELAIDAWRGLVEGL
jgi:glycosyltransferase involved in cell wall biosynthesis